MEQRVFLNKNGVTLIELMVSLVIITIVSLALMKTTLLGIKVNLQNSLRDEAVNIVELRMNELRSLSFPIPPSTNDLTATANAVEPVIQRNFRSFSQAYSPMRTVTDLNSDAKQVTLSVSWIYSGQTYTHTVTTIMRKQ